MEATGIPTEDRISELPVHIIHQMLCQTEIPLKEAARTCVLSKRWCNFWTSRPNLILSQDRYGNGYKCMSAVEFVNYVDKSLRPHVEQNLRLEQFSLTYRQILASHMDRWIDMVAKLNVKVLELHGRSFGAYYSLPDAIYAGREMKTLKLERCKFEFDTSKTNIITFCNLENLKLWNVHILEDQLQRVFARCPFMRTLQLDKCKGINNVHVFGLVHLENLVVGLCELKSLIVQAPNLRYFLYKGEQRSENNLVPCKISILDGCNTLETLILRGAVTEQQFQDMFSKYSMISELNLTNCDELKNIEIVRKNLKKLTLSWLWNLEQVKIEAPNLLEFEFKGDKIPFDLPHFVQKFNYSKALILAIFCEKTKTIFIYEDPKETFVPLFDKVRILFRHVKHLESFIEELMKMYPKTMSILPITNSKLLQVVRTLIGCPDDAKTKRSYWKSRLKEVSIYTIEKEVDAVWYNWLKSTPLFDQVTTFMSK